MSLLSHQKWYVVSVADYCVWDYVKDIIEHLEDIISVRQGWAVENCGGDCAILKLDESC